MAKGFFTDTTHLHRLQSLRGGLQAVEPVAGRWLLLQRHVVRQHRVAGRFHVAACELHRTARGARPARTTGAFSWLMSSDVCKHCARAGCLENCPTGAIMRTEFDTVYVQPDICNGCGYCVVGCPFGVIDRREDDGRAWKCTLCYDRLTDDMTPACAKACPTASIQFGEIEQLRDTTRAPALRSCTSSGVNEAYLYGVDAENQPGTGGLERLLPAGR